MKRLVRIFLGFALFVAVVLVAIALGAGRIVKAAVEREGTASLRLATTLDRATVSVLQGKVSLHGLAIASPHGFSAPHMLELKDLAVQVGVSELRSQPIHIGQISIDEPTLVIEQSGGALNFRKAMEAIPASPKDNKEPMKLVIDELKLERARVLIRPGLPGVGQEIPVEVPSLTLKNIGRGRGAENGAAMKDVAMHVISALAAAAAQSNQVPPQIRALLGLNASQVVSALGAEAQKRLSEALPGAAGKAASGALKDPAAAAKDPGAVLKELGGANPPASPNR